MTADEYKPTKEEQPFLKYYEKLIWQTLYARAHLKLQERLESYKSDYLKELNQAPHFFTFTIRAHLDDALLTLSRILDKHDRSLSIWKFLSFVEQNSEIFSNEAFAQRMSGKSDYYEYQVKSHTPITLQGIEEDRQKLRSLEGTISNIKGWRDKVFAHVDREFHLKGRHASEEYPLQRQQLEEVITALARTINRYSASYQSSTFLEKFPDEDDVQHIMNSIRFHIQERNKQLEAFRKQALTKR